MQDKTWYSILGLDAEPLFLQDRMLKWNSNSHNQNVIPNLIFEEKILVQKSILIARVFVNVIHKVKKVCNMARKHPGIYLTLAQ